MNKKDTIPMVPGLFRICCCVTALLLAVFLIAACAGVSPVPDNAPGFSGILGKAWYLVKIRTETGDIDLDRSIMEIEGVGDAFVLQFEEDRINGIALPNRYFGPYTQKGQTISFKGIAATLMASTQELDVLKENEYFDYLERVHSWGWKQGSLELYSAAPDGQRAVLVFNEGSR
ncbi:MAG: META domain-containing protein [Spirochaetaceae bacterium]|nr:META domain-containing protein [Spirochaetaceae bacterium]